MAEDKKKVFEAEVFGNQSQKEIPIDTKIVHDYEIRASVAFTENLS